MFPLKVLSPVLYRAECVALYEVGDRANGGSDIGTKKVDSDAKVLINMVITGELASSLIEWRRRGIINSYTDGVLQALRVFNQSVIEQDLVRAKLMRLKDLEELNA